MGVHVSPSALSVGVIGKTFPFKTPSVFDGTGEGISKR